jgi:hypothetical protein
MRPRRGIVWLLTAPLAALLLAMALTGSGVAVADHLEARRAFCNGCHLPDGKALHAAKMRHALERPGLDLTGVHFAKALQGRFTCADCHRGAGWQERSHVLWGSAVNTLRYAASSFREPEALARPILNAACTQCHTGIANAGDPSRYHGMDAHLDQSALRCTACHLGHASGEDPARQAQRLVSAATATCRVCHKGEPLAPQVLALLGTYQQALQQRMQPR